MRPRNLRKFMLSSSIKTAKIFLLILFLFTVSNAQKPTPTPTQDEETDRVFTEEIKLNVSAVNTDGKFVADVKPEDLVITEDNRIHQASSLRRIPANVLIVMDTGGEMRQAKSFDRTKAAAKALINALAPQDSIALMDYHDRVEIIGEWTNKEDALKIVDKKTNFGKRSVFTDALEAAAKFLLKTPLDNQHLVLITDGTDSLNNLAERKAAMQKLLATDVNVHVISYTKMELIDIAPRAKGVSATPPKGLPPEVAAQMPNGVRDVLILKGGVTINTDRAFLKKMRERQQDLIDGEKYLNELSADTNGEFILPESAEEMISKTALVASVVDSSYVVTYAPKRLLSESKAGEIRSIEVTSRRPNLLVQARRKLIVENSAK